MHPSLPLCPGGSRSKAAGISERPEGVEAGGHEAVISRVRGGREPHRIADHIDQEIYTGTVGLISVREERALGVDHQIVLGG
jgi:hypothetical protein